MFPSNRFPHYQHFRCSFVGATLSVETERVVIWKLGRTVIVRSAAPHKALCALLLSSSVSDSGSSQGLSQPSTQTTQYLRADTPNNAALVTSKRFYLPRSHQEHNIRHTETFWTLKFLITFSTRCFPLLSHIACCSKCSNGL